MSKIDELIQELCPDGVKFLQLSEVAVTTIGEFVHKNKQKPDGLYPVYNGGRSETGFYNHYNNTGNKIVISARGAYAGFVNRVVKPYWAGNSSYSISIKNTDQTDWGYLYYYLKKSESKFTESQQKGGIPAVSKKQVESFKIPIPPLEVQKEIVNILDKFTQLEAELSAELSAELEARRKQYNFYRNQLLTFDDRVKYLKLADIMNKTSGTKVTAAKMKDLHKEGAPVKIFAGGKTYAHFEYSDLPEKDINTKPSVVVKSRGFIEFEYIDTPFSHKNEFWSYNCKNENINTKFVYYFLKNNEPYFQRLGGMMQMPQISSGDTNNFKIPIPSLDNQARIVEILDKFDDLTNSIAKGLPAEIAARRKQYEYYRTKLLTFKELK